ncbi:hypothetical protein [Candidatus Amarolinea dominans]|uniref:hypothetical protein n=1 Tax=Candidatus Amarolinea dominans TaxID=3140696 RepID=UPI0031352003|nr:hypothetical protein [Anaerolineae bacterium]
MTDANRIAEASVAYGSAVADLQRPLILEREGQPLAVLISFEEYRRLRAIESNDESAPADQLVCAIRSLGGGSQPSKQLHAGGDRSRNHGC